MHTETTIHLLQQPRLKNYLENCNEFLIELRRVWPNAADELKKLGIDLPQMNRDMKAGDEWSIATPFCPINIALRYVAASGDLSIALVFFDVDWMNPGTPRILYSARLASVADGDDDLALVGMDDTMFSSTPFDMSWRAVYELIRKAVAIKLDLDSAPFL